MSRSVRYIGTISDDNNGLFIEKYLREKGVDISYVYKQKGKWSGFSQVWINKQNGSRTIAYSTGTLDPLTENYVTEELIRGSEILHIDGREPEATGYVADLASKLGILVTFDTGDLKPQSENLLKKANVVISPLRFSQDLFGTNDLKEAAERLKSFGPDIVVITNGEHGLICTSKEETFFQRSYPIKAIDTTSAGDIFCGAFIHTLLLKLSLKESIAFASAAAALKCMRLGKENLPKEEKIFAFARKYK